MANRKISDLTALTAPATGDLLPIVDISEAAAADKNKKITYGELLASAPAGSAAAPSFSFESDPNTGIYSPGADQVAISTNGTGRLFIDASGNIGVSATPGSTGFDLGYLSGNDFYLFNRKNGAAVFGTNNAEYMRITSAGLVGIGTSSPNRKLEVSDATVDNFIRVNTTGATKSGIEFASGGTVYSQLYFNNTSPYDLSLLQQYSTGSLILGTNNTERARIDSSGRLLVGTSSARANFFNSSNSARFQIEGSGGNDNYALSIVSNFAGGTNGAQVILAKSGGSNVGDNTLVTNGNIIGQITFQGADGTDFVEAARISAEVDGTPGANDMPGRLVFSTTADGAASPTERMRIDSTGALKTSTNGTYKFPGGVTEITHNDATSSVQLIASSTSFTGDAVTISAYRNTTNSTYNFLSCVRQGFQVTLLVRDSGNVVNVNNSYGALSDIKLKENIVDANSQWDDLKALQVRNYNFKEGQTHTQIGLVAQEVELVSPGLVSESPDRDAEGNDLGTVTKGVNYSVLYMKAVKALQEAMERIEALEADVAQLKGA